MNDHWNVLYQVSVFYADRKSKVATTVGNRLTLDPMGKCSNAFFSETTNQIESKLDRNVHWMFIYYNWKSKMAATAGHRLTMGKCSNMNIMRSGSMTFVACPILQELSFHTAIDIYVCRSVNETVKD